MNNTIDLKVLKNTEDNLKALIAIGENTVSKDYHILANKQKLALISHYIWETCDYCNCECDKNGIINMER